MNFLTEPQFKKEIEKYKYWKNPKRWEYMKIVIEDLKKHNPSSILEIGSNYIPLSFDSFLICLKKEELVNKEGIVWDINNVPFPLKDNQFDFSVALQVWEHLDNQQNAFKELYRISKNIILSFPYKWKSTKCNRHYNITDEKINEWTCNLPYNEYFIIGKKHKRKICIWRK